MNYYYFVSYAHEKGFGSVSVKLTFKIQCWDDIDAIKNELKDGNSSDIAVLYYKLLRIE